MKNVRWPWSLIIILFLGGILRLPFLDRFPPSLYSDEVSQGYNAYSILKTGRDEFGTFLPVSIRSFGDWKPPLPTYLMIPTIAAFGLNGWGVRLPSAILGTLSVPLVYFLTKELFDRTDKTDRNEKIALLTALFLAISPWHILQSRVAMLVIIASFWIYLGLWAFFKGLRNDKYWFATTVAFGMAIYSYYGMRLVVPSLVVLLMLQFRRQVLLRLKTVCLNLSLMSLLLLPLGVAYLREPDVVWGRAKTVSVFYDRGVALTVWDLIAQDGPQMPALVAQFLHNKPYHYAIDVVRRFSQHFDGRFLFSQGDLHPPFQIPGMGVMYLLDGLLGFVGILGLIKSQPKLFRFLLILISIFILPASLTFMTPSANRTFTAVFPLTVLTAVGVFSIYRYMRKKWLIVGVGILVYSLSFIYFAYSYLIILPKQHADWWHYGYKELTEYLDKIKTDYELVTLAVKPSVAYSFFLFYQKVDPGSLNTDLRRNLHSDEFGFEHVSRYKNYQFLRNFKWQVDGERLVDNSLLVINGAEQLDGRAQRMHQIFYPNGDVAFTLYKIKASEKL